MAGGNGAVYPQGMHSPNPSIARPYSEISPVASPMPMSPAPSYQPYQPYAPDKQNTGANVSETIHEVQ
jgi:hypothetical protein